MVDLDETIKKIHILVVDDMESIRSMVNSCLRELGVDKITFAVNGKLAWKDIEKGKIDLIISDWDMPQVTGIELLERVRASDIYKNVPFLMLTASTDKSRVIGAVKLGANDYLAKPFQPKELEYRVLKLLRKVKLKTN